MPDPDAVGGNGAGGDEGADSGADGAQGNGNDSESAGTTSAGEEVGSETSAADQDQNGNGLETSQNDVDQNFGTDPAGGGVQSCGSSAPAQVVVDPQKKHWIAIEMVDVEGKPVSGQDFQITLPDGSTVEGSLDNKGRAKITGIDAGNCQITFPKLDQDSWKPQ